jgi:hypothetical protein
VENSKQITLNNLLNSGNLVQNEKLFEDIVALRDVAIQDSKLKPAALILTSCNHFISDPNLLRRSHGEQVYSSLEVPCPICKRPSNTLLPVLRRDIFELLNQLEQDSTPSISGINLNTMLKHLICRSEPTSAEMIPENSVSKYFDSKDAYAEDGFWRVLTEESSTLESFYNSSITNYLGFTDLLDRAGKKTKSRLRWSSTNEILHHSLTYVLRYLELSGLASHIHEFSYIYHNFYLLLRAEYLNASREASTELYRSGLSSRTQKLVSLVSAGDPRSASFEQADIEELFATIIPLIVNV